ALALAQSLADTASAQLADRQETGPAEIKPDNSPGAKKTDGHLQHHAEALRAWEAGSNTDADGKTAKDQAGQQPLLILSAPAGLAASTDNSLTLAAGSNIDSVALRDSNQTSGRRWLHNVGQHISLFVAGVKDKVSLKLIAAKGKVQIQAQSDALELTADKDVTVTSCKGKVVIAAKQDILLASGGGYIKLSGGNIDIHCPGNISIKGAKHELSGGGSLAANLPPLPQPGKHWIAASLMDADGQPVTGAKYKIRFDSGMTHTGVLDQSGIGQRHQAVPLEPAQVTYELPPPKKETAPDPLKPLQQHIEQKLPAGGKQGGA
ncbi:DUF2345 domain-containing protein, partial [Vogesella mureinivorans]|uniref:DUF2345 domain-containing protein n=1 Tax=Vogesella mureinivorans TaxID=657276 RepID=UPI0011C863E4